jgi:hypothetical protein
MPTQRRNSPISLKTAKHHKRFFGHILARAEHNFAPSGLPRRSNGFRLSCPVNVLRALCYQGEQMTTQLNRLLLCFVLAALTASIAVAQDGTSDSKSKSDVRTISGCLTKGDSADEFVLTGNDGSTWEARASKSGVDLASHVGHTISATGVVSNAMAHNVKEDAKDTAKDTGMKKNNTEHGHLKITDVRMLSDSCQN